MQQKFNGFVTLTFIWLTMSSSALAGMWDHLKPVETVGDYTPPPTGMERAIQNPETLGIWVLVGIGIILLFVLMGRKKSE